MKDVAALAGVSVGTVSNVLNAPHLVAEPTRQRVVGAIDKLGWVRNDSARQLRAGRSLSVGLIVLDLGNPFFTDVARAVEEFCYGQGHSVHVGNSDQAPEREATLLRHFAEQRVAGVILAPIADNGEPADQARRSGLPVVLVDRANNPSFCCVGVDDIDGGYQAAHHLVSQGHRRLAFVGSPDLLTQVRDRRRGVDLAMEGTAAQCLALPTDTLGAADGRRAAESLAALPAGERPTGVVAANDLLAIGLLQGLVGAGLRVPDDVALVGYDDIEFAAAAAVPLSSVRQPRRELGLTAARLLFEEMAAADGDQPHAHRVVKLTPELVVRRSSQRRL
jgi:LacI family transcriptional regulator